MTRVSLFRSLVRQTGSYLTATPSRAGPARAMGHGHKVYIETTRTEPTILPGTGYDSEWFHSEEQKRAATDRWVRMSQIALVIVAGTALFVYIRGEEHHDSDGTEYAHNRTMHKMPKYPWGNRELFGTPQARERWREEDAAKMHE